MKPLSERLSGMATAYHLLGETDLPTLLREAAELARRVEAAAAADIREDGKNGGESALLSAATRAGYYQGQRVRIVPEAGLGVGK